MHFRGASRKNRLLCSEFCRKRDKKTQAHTTLQLQRSKEAIDTSARPSLSQNTAPLTFGFCPHTKHREQTAWTNTPADLLSFEVIKQTLSENEKWFYNVELYMTSLFCFNIKTDCERQSTDAMKRPQIKRWRHEIRQAPTKLSQLTGRNYYYYQLVLYTIHKWQKARVIQRHL